MKGMNVACDCCNSYRSAFSFNIVFVYSGFTEFVFGLSHFDICLLSSTSFRKFIFCPCHYSFYSICFNLHLSTFHELLHFLLKLVVIEVDAFVPKLPSKFLS